MIVLCVLIGHHVNFETHLGRI